MSELTIEILQQERDKWKRRAERFLEAYKDLQSENLAHEIRQMTWESDGGADYVLRSRVHSMHTKMLAACIERNEAREEIKRLNSLYLDKPEDRLYHAADKTWWRKEDGVLKRAEPPIEVEGRLLEAQRFVDEAAHREIESLNKVLAAARAVINNPAWAGVCDEDIGLEQAIREYDKEKPCQQS